VGAGTRASAIVNGLPTCWRKRQKKDRQADEEIGLNSRKSLKPSERFLWECRARRAAWSARAVRHGGVKDAIPKRIVGKRLRRIRDPRMSENCSGLSAPFASYMTATTKTVTTGHGGLSADVATGKRSKCPRSARTILAASN
jgi:hypothetical protein